MSAPRPTVSITITGPLLINFFGVDMSAQGDRIKAVLAAFSQGADGAVSDITELVAKIRTGAPDLLSEAELAGYEAKAAALKALVDSTDPATIEPDAPAGDPPADEV